MPSSFKKPRLASNTDDSELPLDPRTAAQLAVPISERYNPSFEEYYLEQLFEKEKLIEYGTFNDFLSALKVALPMTLRVQQTRSKAVRIRTGEQLASLKLKRLDWVDQFLPPTDNEPSLVWECSDEEYHSRPELETFCRRAHRGGAVNFQESVSMLPAFLLDIQEHHNMADVCAAPGSKTTLALDLMHRSLGGSSPQGPFPSGMMIASEFDSKRAKLLLAGRVRHLTTANCLIGIAPAQSLPEPIFGGMFDRVLADVPCSGDGTIRKDPRQWRSWSPKDGLELHGIQLKILRKALKMLKPGGMVAYSTCSFNPIENEAVVTAALVATLMFPSDEKTTSPEFELVDIHALLQEKGVSCLNLAPGLTYWRVPLLDSNQSRRWGPKMDSNWQDKYHANKFAVSSASNGSMNSASTVNAPLDYDRSSWWAHDLDTYLERRSSSTFSSTTQVSKQGAVQQQAVPNKHKKTPPQEGWLPAGVKRTMFPASQEFSHFNQELKKCARVLPNKQNGGGFFVALIRRKEVVEIESSHNSSEDSCATTSSKATVPSDHGLNSIATVSSSSVSTDASEESSGLAQLLTSQLSLYQSLVQFYGLDLTNEVSCLLVEGPRIVLTSEQLSSFVTQKLVGTKALNQNGTKLFDFNVHTFGLRIFLKLQTSQIRASFVRWRPCQEGIGWLAKHSTKRKLLVHVDLLHVFLKHHEMSCELATELSRFGLLMGYPDILENREQQAYADGKVEDISERSTIVAGGLLVGCLLGSKDGELSDEDSSDNTVWVACLATTKSIHVYADENSLFGIKELLNDGKCDASTREDPTTRNAVEALFSKYAAAAAADNQSTDMKPDEEE